MSSTFRSDVLAGRVALVTGGTSGIGAAVAEALSTAGDVVTVTGATQAECDAARAAPIVRTSIARGRACIAGALAAVALAGLLAACGSGTPTATPLPSAPPDVAGSPAPVPSLSVPDSWPSEVVTAVVALGAADAEFASAGGDLIAAANTSDLELMLGAANGLAALVEANRPNAEALAGFEPFAELGAAYVSAFDLLGSGAASLSEAIRTGDAEGIVEGSRTIAAGVAAYGEVREPLSVLLPDAIRQAGGKVK